MTRKTAWEKLQTPQQAKIEDDPRGKMLIPRPLDLDALVRAIPRGHLATVTQLRERLARDHGADFTCPLTTGIFLRIVAEAAEEQRAEGKPEIAPYWRVVKEDGSLNEKFPGGAEAQAARLREEGHAVLPGRGKKPPRVEDVQSRLQTL